MTDTERLRRLDRENEELRDMLNQVAWRLGLGDEVHYYADNYLACQLRVLDAIEGLTEREQDVETVRSDAMEAWEWVREHGGLSHVKDIYHDLRAVVERLGIEWSESELHVLMDTLDRRLMPEGYEWPRYDASEPARIGGAIADELGHGHVVTSVELHEDGAALHWNPAEPEECVWVGHGEPVRRPTKPEPPDSWERIEEDARLKPLGYVDRVLGWDMRKSHSENQARSAMTHDLVRRCKALAEMECDLVRRCKSMAERCE